MAPTPRCDLTVTSFGFGHGAPPPADIVLDLRDWFRDPHVSPRLRHMTGHDPEVAAAVLATPGVRAFVGGLHAAIAPLVDLGRAAVTVAVGCVGGRHRGVVVAEALAAQAALEGWIVDVEHRDVGRPVLQRAR